MVECFHRSLWKSWHNGRLNWNDIDFQEFDSLPMREKKWLNDQEWILQDPSRFYYPLFGLGNVDSSIAIVAAGPGHNINDPWKCCTQGAEYREYVEGPYMNEELWFGTFQEPEIEYYESNFEDQKNKWEDEREGNSTIYRRLASVVNGDLLFQNAYYTNFMKDGEFVGDRSSDGVPLDRQNICDELIDKEGSIQFEDHPSNLIRANYWKEGVPKTESRKPEVICEIASREFWLPFLSAELATVNPDVIIPLGAKSSEAIWKIYGVEEEFDKITTHSLKTYKYQNSDVTILPSLHLSNLGNAGQIENQEISDKSDRKLDSMSDEYLRRLSNKALNNAQ